MHTRFYHPAEIAIGQIIELSPENKHHAARVLRLKRGNTVTVFNGKGGEFSGHIHTISKSNINIVIEAYHTVDCESPLHIELAQAICVNEKMDWIIQKAVEAGVSSIQPISTARSIVHLSDERSSKRLQHWQKIVISACEQCGRNRLPQMLPLLNLPEWLSQKKTAKLPQDLHFMLSPSATETFKNIPKPSIEANLVVLIGPEGGYTQEETAAILHAGLIPLRLGKRILRTESAALATIATLQTLWGDYLS
jgi:16S rRNA (uracil1498-N3)-methyltransferase